MNDGDFVKFIGEHPEYWDIDDSKTHVVQQAWNRKGDQEYIQLRNKKGKLRLYPEHLFEKIKIPENPKDEHIKNLTKIWLQDNREESKKAWEELNGLDQEWQKACLFKKGMIVKFISGIEAGKYEGRIFRCQSNPKFTSVFSGCMRLAGLYGFHDLTKLEIVESSNRNTQGEVDK